MRIGIVGAGVAGASLAELLVRQGQEVLLLDHRAPWEKPCGGGITSRALEGYPGLLELPLARQEIREVVMIGPTGRRAGLAMQEIWHTVSRQELARVLLQRAEAAGARFIRRRVQRIIKSSGFQLETAGESFQVDFLVGADGATGLTRRTLAGKWDPADLCRCYGFLLPRSGDLPLFIRFYPDMAGYAWIFPRPGQLFSAGIAASGSRLPREALVQRLCQLIEQEMIQSRHPVPNFPKPYAALLPSLSAASFASPRVAGPNWALVGDASGAVDPVTGEGISYAFKTARLLAEAIAQDQGRSYPERWQEMVRTGIGHAGTHRWRERFYRPWVMRLYLLFLQQSRLAQDVTRDLFSGRQSYHDLKPRVIQAAPAVILQTLRAPFTHRAAP